MFVLHFLRLFSNEMKSSFLFYDGTTHADKYRMNDVTMIYKYLLKNFASIVMNLSISSPQKTADNT